MCVCYVSNVCIKKCVWCVWEKEAKRDEERPLQRDEERHTNRDGERRMRRGRSGTVEKEHTKHDYTG